MAACSLAVTTASASGDGWPMRPMRRFSRSCVDAEVFSGLARLHRAGEFAADEVDELLRRLRAAGRSSRPDRWCAVGYRRPGQGPYRGQRGGETCKGRNERSLLVHGGRRTRRGASTEASSVRASVGSGPGGGCRIVNRGSPALPGVARAEGAPRIAVQRSGRPRRPGSSSAVHRAVHRPWAARRGQPVRWRARPSDSRIR
jgi:hypothetical protein